MTKQELEQQTWEELSRIQYIKKLQCFLDTPIVSNEDLNKLERKLMRGMECG